ncbi:inositol monophosphatase family protein [Sulfolobus tengchongensis]|uniref:Inositol monophosphatase family protein n=1 Tax=Sulfolobus tengchongensis TaxID=207809 RepID=A0AAX4L2G0_9CREN
MNFNLDKIAIEISKFINEIKDEKDIDKVVGFHSGDTTRLIDKKSEDYIFELLNSTGYKFRFVSEESGVVNTENYEYTALIDPLDGSNNFVMGVPWYSVSVAVYDKNAKGILDSIGGFVSHILLDKIYAYDDKRAYLNGIPLQSEEVSKELSSKVIITYFEDKEIDKVLRILPNIQGYKIRSFGSASLDMILVCTGKAYMYFDIRGKLRNVDIAASSNFCKRLNLVPTNLNGKEIFTGIDDIYRINEIILSRDSNLMKKIYSIFS